MAKTKTSITGVSENLSDSIQQNIEKEKKNIILPLAGIKIGISVSDSDDYHQLGFSEIHQKDITIEFTRYLLSNGAHLVYGGDLRLGGYTAAFSEIAFQYRKIEEKNEMLFTNYFGWPIHLKLKSSDEAYFKRNRVKIKKIGRPEEAPEQLDAVQILPDSIENRFYWAKSMAKMRIQMTSGSMARIFLGGRTKKYTGFYPGIIEEAYLALAAKQPIYLIGAFGGATAYIVRAFKGESAQKLANELLGEYPTINELYNYADGIQHQYLSITSIFSYFVKTGLKGISKLNKLTEEQNEILFTTTHFPEIIYYTLVGLNKTAKSL